jgi:hypothetical protein
MAKGKKKAGAKQAQNTDEDDDFLDALHWLSGGWRNSRTGCRKKKETTASVAVEKKVEDKPGRRRSILATQGLGS